MHINNWIASSFIVYTFISNLIKEKKIALIDHKDKLKFIKI